MDEKSAQFNTSPLKPFNSITDAVSLLFVADNTTAPSLSHAVGDCGPSIGILSSGHASPGHLHGGHAPIAVGRKKPAQSSHGL